MHPLVNIAISAARQAGDIIVRHIDQLDRIKISAKSPQDFFSEVDIKAEQAIIDKILKAYPEHGIIAEESGAHNSHAEVVWLIDPIDGTNNYLHNFPFYAVSIAIQVKGRIEHGVVYDPLRHECFAATRGQGARLNDRRIRVSKTLSLQTAMLSTGLSKKNPELVDRYLNSFAKLFTASSSLRRTGSAALDLAYVGAGRIDGFWEFALKPWDVAAGSLIALEAGAFVSDTAGGVDYIKNGDIVAATPKVFKELLQKVHSCL